MSAWERFCVQDAMEPDDEGSVDAGDLEDLDALNAEPPIDAAIDVEDEKGVTRFQLIEYMNQREWWRKSQKTLCFTGVLWAIFAYMAVVRSSVRREYEVQEALVSYVESIISHPGVSGVRLRTPGETGMLGGQDLYIDCKNMRSISHSSYGHGYLYIYIYLYSS